MGWNGQMGTAMGQPMIPNNGTPNFRAQIPQGHPQLLHMQQQLLDLQEQVNDLEQELQALEQENQRLRGVAHRQGRGQRRGRGRGRGGRRGNVNNGNHNNNNSAREATPNGTRNNRSNNHRGRDVLAPQDPGRVSRPKGTFSTREQELQRMQARIRALEEQDAADQRARIKEEHTPQASAAAPSNVKLETGVEDGRAAFAEQHPVSSFFDAWHHVNNLTRVSQVRDQQPNNNQPIVKDDPEDKPIKQEPDTDEAPKYTNTGPSQHDGQGDHVQSGREAPNCQPQ